MIKWLIDISNLCKILLVFIVLIVMMGSTTWAAFSRMKNITDETVHSTLVVATMKTMFINMLDAETGQRGYLLTNDDAYTGRTRETDQGDKIVVERFGKNLGKPTSREVIRK